MFGYMIDDTPMLFVKKPGADITMLNEYFEQGSFTLKDWNEWGFRVTTDKLGEIKVNIIVGYAVRNTDVIMRDYFNLLNEQTNKYNKTDVKTNCTIAVVAIIAN